MSTLAEEIFEAVRQIAGEHPGHRGAHAKGTLLAGTFTPNASGSSLTTAAHLQDEPSRVTARFSNGGADPAIPDYAREARGLSVKFYLPDGGKTDILAITLPCFMVRTPEDFLSFTQARQDPEKLMPDWLGAHPEALPAIQAASWPPRTARQLRHLHVQLDPFGSLTDADGGSRFVRYRWEPEAGEQTLSSEDAKARGRDYLQEEILARGESAFRLQVIVATEEDRGGRPDGGMARGARARRGGPPGPRRPRPRARARRRHPRVRSHARDRRNRAVGRRGPAVPPHGLLDVGGAPTSAAGRQVERLAPRRALAHLLLTLDLGVQLGAEEQGHVGEPQPRHQQDRPGEGAVERAHVRYPRDVQRERRTTPRATGGPPTAAPGVSQRNARCLTSGVT